MPNNANITINRKSSKSSEAIDCIEFKREATRFDRERQYLKKLVNRVLTDISNNLTPAVHTSKVFKI